MKHFIRIAAAFLASATVLTSGLSFANAVSASSTDSAALSFTTPDSYIYTNTDYGMYPTFTDTYNLGLYLRENMVNRTSSVSFYYEGLSSDAISSTIAVAVDKAFQHTGTADEGDYLRYNFSGYGGSYRRYLPSGADSYVCFFSLTLTYYDNLSQENTVETRINEVLSGLSLSGMTDYQKFSAIYSWIAANVDYDYTNYYLDEDLRDPVCYTAYGALINHTAVCQGCANLLYRMCLTAGIDCRTVVSDTHAWNIVKIGNYYYNCDITWDLNQTPGSFSYFLVPNSSYFLYYHPETDELYSYYNISPSSYDTTATAVLTGVDGFVERLYVVSLGRASDSAGFESWKNQLVTFSMTGADVARGFIFSEEFSNRNLPDDVFLDVLYSTFFDRRADNEGKLNWLNALGNGMSRTSVVEGFINSQEWANVCLRFGIASGSTALPSITVTPSSEVTEFVSRLYSIALGRTPDPVGSAYWSSALANAQIGGVTAAHGFFFSEEFLNSGCSDQEYVTKLYRTFLNREPDQTGYDYWMQVLSQTGSREAVFNGFAYSTEFAALCTAAGILR